MIVLIDKSFEKDLKKINVLKLNTQVKNLIIELIAAKNITEITNLKKLAGFKTYYRIRLGNYRIGINLTNANELELVRILHRKDIYNYFP